ncbi:MAG: efflux RND transporter periplasmic adaptor subunit [Flavobacteriaceae bacterium]
MKQRILYLGTALLAGLGLGYMLFNGGTSHSTSTEVHNHSAANPQQWTCSMHPQILQQEPGDCPICGMDLIPAESTASGLAPEQFKITPNALALANIQTSIVEGATTQGATQNLSGKISINEEQIAVQASYYAGRIERLFINYTGQEVQKGQVLATLYAPQLVAAQQELLTAAALKETQPQLYRAVRKKLQLWKLTDKEIEAIEVSGKVREYFPIRATVGGTVTALLGSEGDYLKEGQAIARVSNLNTLWANFDAYERQLSQFRVGQKIEIYTSAYPNKKVEGTISFISPLLNNDTRTATLRATVKNNDKVLKPGMFVSGKITTAPSTTKAVSIPASAVLWTGKRSLVYVKAAQDSPIFEMREVTLGQKNGAQVEIIEGLSIGEEIVTKGTFTVDAAAQLQGKKSMMNNTGGKTMTGHEGHTGVQENHDSSTAMKQTMKMNFSDSFQKDFKPVLLAYLKVKDALVASDAPQTVVSAKATLEALNAIPTSNLGKMEQEHFNASVKMLEAIAAKTNLNNQRSHFVLLNEHLVALVSAFSTLENTLYVQQCPMANNNQGAVWLSKEKDIRNPYFGADMLKCGSTIKSL